MIVSSLSICLFFFFLTPFYLLFNAFCSSFCNFIVLGRALKLCSLVLFSVTVEREKHANARENRLPRGHATVSRVSLILLSYSKFTERRRQQRFTNESRRDLLFTPRVVKRRRLKPVCKEAYHNYFIINQYFIRKLLRKVVFKEVLD